MNTAYIFIVIMYSTITNQPIGAQTFDMQNLSECMQIKEYTDEKIKAIPKEIKAVTGCFPNLGGTPRQS